MSEDIPGENKCAEEACNPKVAIRKKRDIFRFNGQKDMSINLEYVHKMSREEKRITFQFSSTLEYIDFENEDSAIKAYEQLLNAWSVEFLL